MTDASLPPRDLPGLDPSWSRLVQSPDSTGTSRTWHVLDRSPDSDAVGTVLCVHGNPTWSYTFRSLVSALGERWRVVAPDHLGMGFSERTGQMHRLADRIDELDALTATLDVHGPVLVVAHDWGGPIALGWCQRHPDRVSGIVLLNTAVSQPDASGVPPLIAMARSSRLLRTVTQRTRAFLDGTLRLAHPTLPREVAAAYRAPYRSASRRQGIADFVADIPLEEDHPSRPVLDAVADGLGALRDLPTLLAWGPRDPVFAPRYLRDLQRRLPHAQTHRFEGAGHLVIEDAPVADVVRRFADDLAAGRTRDLRGHPPLLPTSTLERRPLWAALEARAKDTGVAVVEMGRRGPSRTITWRQLHDTVRDLSAGLSAIGVQPQERVALLVPPGAASRLSSTPRGARAPSP